MCGIAGVLGGDGATPLEGMLDALVHRGPDGRGTHVVEGAALGATRLAIVDPDGGEQPFVDGDLALVANAEIYEHEALRADLERDGARFRSQCDAEVILHAYRRWGLDCVRRLDGFFAFALWDGARRRLFCARDAFGIAPLVWTRLPGGGLAFASEVKGLLAVPGVRTRLDPGALDDLLAMRWAAEPTTWWRGVEHLAAGHRLVAEADGEPRVDRWYAPPPAGSGGETDPRAAAERLGDALAGAVDRRLQGDAALGLYLSGGLDSSTIAGLLGRAGRPVAAWSHGFDRAADETPSAERVARHTGLPWHEVRMVPDDLDALPDIVRAMEQPVANSDVVGLWVLAREARRSVRVVLSGEGADEIFGSYPHHRLLTALEQVPPVASRAAGGLLDRLPGRLLDLASPYAGLGSDPEARRRLADVLSAHDLSGRYEAATALFPADARADLYRADLAEQVRRRPGRRHALLASLAVAAGRGAADRLVDLELRGWLQGYHLGRANRIAMAHGLEARYPFLDRDVAEHVVALPAALRSGPPWSRGKAPLRRVASDLLPRSVARRPKGPVRVPLSLFGGRFRELARDLLSPARVRDRGLFRPEAVQRLLAGLDRPSFLVERQVFALVLVELWHEAFRPEAP